MLIMYGTSLDVGSAFTEAFIAAYSAETTCSEITGRPTSMHFKAMPCHAGKALLAAAQACLIFYEVGSALSEGEKQ